MYGGVIECLSHTSISFCHCQSAISRYRRYQTFCGFQSVPPAFCEKLQMYQNAEMKMNKKYLKHFTGVVTGDDLYVVI